MSTHPAKAIPPAQFRDQATGIGQTRSASQATGAARKQRVIDCMPGAVKRAVAPAQGYGRSG